ncbi:6-phospho-beta-glucosidase [Paludibaculum fermentans]|uniref:family 4 glycosyl hydrolase n=1 Tax=Paludibaculum fermentans TaxID=1473598 RepID=UPI003EBFFD9B
MKAAILGGGGVRTPLLIHGLVHAAGLRGLSEVMLFDADEARTEMIAALGREIVQRAGASVRIGVSTDLAAVAEGAGVVFNSIRVGGITARAADEQVAMAHGLAGQETTGPGGVAMALRTIPVTLMHAATVERVAPRAWFLNFTNPAGLITQALLEHSGVRAVGICDTPIELFHRIAGALGAQVQEMEFDYAGLNHLGWVRQVRLRGEDVTKRLLRDETRLRAVYPDTTFDPELMQALGLIPSEYLFFYYRQRRALANQMRAGASRGGEIAQLNVELFQQLGRVDSAHGLDIYKNYLRRRNASYMKLETEAGSVFGDSGHTEDPFETATGYHRVAVAVLEALESDEDRTVVANVANRGAVMDLEAEDVVEVPCAISRRGVVAKPVGRLPESVRGLVLAVKAYERATIRAAVEKSGRLAELAMLEYPLIGQWDLARELLQALVQRDPEHLGYLA